MTKRLFILFCFSFLCDSSSLKAQDDTIWWSTYRLRITASESLEFDIRPTARFNENIGAFRDASIDFVARKKVNQYWKAGLLVRPWILENKTYRFFLWPAMIYSHSFNKLKFQSRFMFHYALDVDDDFGPDADFFRLRPQLSHKLGKKLSAAIALEPFFRFNKVNDVNRIRYEFALNYSFNSKWNFDIQYRWQDSVGPARNGPDFSVFVTTLTYKMKVKPKEKKPVAPE